MRAGRESGAALVVALVAATAVAATVLLLAVMLDSRQEAAAFDRRGVALSALADAAVAETLAELAADPSFEGVAERSFGDGTIRSTVGVTPSGMTLVTGVGAMAGWRCVVTVEVAMTGGPRVLRARRVHVPP